MELKIFNTLGRQKQVFKPLNPEKVGIYTCGPTVYSKPHIGNMRSYIFAGLLRNVIEHILGYKVTHVVNITDVGHLTDDADEGEDKIEKASREQKKSAYEIAREYENIFFEYLRKLNLSFDIFPRATEHIKEQINMIKILEKKGYAYKIPDDGIYMDTSKVKDYGKLLPKGHLEGILACARVKNDKKKNKTDFALWKFSPKDKKRQMEWDSPWGVGFPGWHIECSAMATKYLGEKFDIHTGGVDHIPVHHTNEIAQSESCFSHEWVNYWVHNQFLNLKSGKMSKSLGNVITIDDVEKKGIDPLAFKYFIYLAHYRSIQEFSWEDLQAAYKAYLKLKNFFSSFENIPTIKYKDIRKIYENKEEGWQIIDYLLDDLDTVKVIAYINSISKQLRGKKDEKLISLIRYIDENILKLDLFKKQQIQIPDEIKQLAEKRWEYKKQKDYENADKIRDLLAKKGYKILDKKDGYEILPG